MRLPAPAGETLEPEQEQGRVGRVEEHVQGQVAARVEAADRVVEGVARCGQRPVEARLEARLPVVAAEETRQVREVPDEGVLDDEPRVVEHEGVAQQHREEQQAQQPDPGCDGA